MDRAGIENMLMNYYRSIDRSVVQFDFLTHRPNIGAYDEEIRSLGGRIYHAPRLYPHNYKEYFRYMNDFFLNHKEYKIIHSHIDAMSYLPLLAAKMNNIPIRIAHSHSTSIEYDYKWLLKEIFKGLIPAVATSYAACSYDAGKFLFSHRKNIKIVYNAIDINRFGFDKKVRDDKRVELNLNDRFVIGHVGRFTKVKNHRFIINVFEEIVKMRENAFLLLVGDGELRNEISLLVHQRKLEDKVLILSNRDDVSELYQAMDVFVLPSKYEGLGMVAVEAQISGLKVLVSSNIPSEVAISDDLEFCKLNKKVWVDRILDLEYCDRTTRYSRQYDIEEASKQLMDYYIGMQTNL